MVIEEVTHNPETGETEYKDVDDCTASAGFFDTFEEANERMNEISDENSGDFRSDDNLNY